MQKALQVISIALLLACAFSGYTPSNFVNAPVVVVEDNQTNFTNQSSKPFLDTPMSSSGLYLIAAKTEMTQAALTASAWFKQVDVKTLTSSATTTYLTWNSTLSEQIYSNGYVGSVFAGQDNVTNASNIYITQKKIDGGADLPVIKVTSNTDKSVNYVVSGVYTTNFGKTGVVLFKTGSTVILTSFTVGGSAAGSNYTLTTALSNNTNPAVAWGESLKSSQVYVQWQETDKNTLKGATYDLSSGLVDSVISAGAWNNTMTCQPFATDKVKYGDLCTYATTENNTDNKTVDITRVYVRNGTDLALLTTYSDFKGISNTGYGPYLTLFLSNIDNGTITLSYQTWNLDTFNATTNRTTYMTYTAGNSAAGIHKVPAGGCFVLAYDTHTANTTVNGYSNVKVGLLLNGSYLSSVIGALMAIIATLFLF